MVPTSAHAERYGRIIQENATKRRLVEAAAKINELAFKEQGSAQQIVDEAEQEIFAISQTTTRKDFMVIKDALAESFDRLDELHKGRVVFAVCRLDLVTSIRNLPVCKTPTYLFLLPDRELGKRQ